MIRVAWLSLDGKDIITKVRNKDISLPAFKESLTDEEFYSFKQRFKYGFQISIETI